MNKRRSYREKPRTVFNRQFVQRTCPICFQSMKEKEMLTAGCGHYICKPCWAGYLEANISEKQKVMSLNCPAVTDKGKPCPVVAPRMLLAQVANALMLGKLTDYEEALMVETNSRASWCAAPGCKAVAIVNGPPPKFPMCAPSTSTLVSHCSHTRRPCHFA